jgi:hypothetical protein
MIKLARPSKCRICKAEYTKRSITHKVCSTECSKLYVEKENAREERRFIKARKLAIKPRSAYLKEAKTTLHAYIRARDEGKCCISCNKILIKAGAVGGDYDAGHFRSVGSAKHMEFVEENIHGQCKYCNNYLAGASIAYRIGLITRYGLPFVEFIETDNTPRKLTISDFEAMKIYYKRKIKSLIAAKQNPTQR